MKLNAPWMTSAVSLPLWLGVRSWMSTLDYRAWYADETVDPLLHVGSPRLYLFWHESILQPLHLRGHCHCAMLLSKHRDADYLARIAGRFGFECVRGSTQRGGARALREMQRRGQAMHLTITPDGPRGPRRECALGPIYLASKLQIPIVSMGFGYDRPWRMRSWDRFAVPRPFSRARAVVGEETWIPQDASREELDGWRQSVQAELNRLSEEAERWATSGTHRDGEKYLHRGKAKPPQPRAQASNAPGEAA